MSNYSFISFLCTRLCVKLLTSLYCIVIPLTNCGGSCYYLPIIEAQGEVEVNCPRSDTWKEQTNVPTLLVSGFGL